MICCRRLIHFEPGIHFVNLRDLLLNPGGEDLYLVLLLRDGCLQILNFNIKRCLPGTVGNRLRPDGFGRGLTGISAGRSRSRSRSG